MSARDAAPTFGLLHVPTGNFIEWQLTREAIEEILARFEEAGRDHFEIVEFDADGMPA